MHQIASFFSKISPGEHAPGPLPPSTSVIPYPYRATRSLSLVNPLIFIKTLNDADQIVKKTLYSYKNLNAFTFFKTIQV